MGGGQNPRQSTLRTKKISFSFHYSEQFVCMCFHNLFTICALQKSLSLSCFPVHEILIFSQIKIRYIYMRSTQKLHRILEDGLFFFFRTQNIFWRVLRYKHHCTPITIITNYPKTFFFKIWPWKKESHRGFKRNDGQ